MLALFFFLIIFVILQKAARSRRLSLAILSEGEVLHKFVPDSRDGLHSLIQLVCVVGVEGVLRLAQLQVAMLINLELLLLLFLDV